MANSNPSPENRFSSDKQPQNNGRPKGILNSKTILERFLSIEQKVNNEVTNEIENLTVEEQMHLAQIKKAKEGDLFAYKEILDRLEGKALAKAEIKQEIEQKVFRVKVKKRDE